MLTAASLAFLNSMAVDPDAHGTMEYMSAALIWSDEWPNVESPDFPAVESNLMASYTSLLAYRASITFGKERQDLRPLWDQVVEHAPRWPGLRPERRGVDARRLLEVARRAMDTDLDADNLEGGGV
jgi:hypothetical protein